MGSEENDREFIENWNLAQTLGEGAYGEVKLLIHRLTGETVAMKMIDLERHQDTKSLVRKEVGIHKILRHPHVLR